MTTHHVIETNFIETNKANWNQKTTEHYHSELYDVKGFLEGKSPLNAIELELLGDIKGKKILHLQCHFGMDSIALSQMGTHVTGVDFSDEAIKHARLLADKVGVDTKFVCCNILICQSIWMNPLTLCLQVMALSIGILILTNGALSSVTT